MGKKKQKERGLSGLGLIFFLGIMLWGSGPLFAHPHVFVQAGVDIVLGEEGVEGVWQHWVFDEYFSAWVIEDFDLNKDGQFCEAELKVVYEETFRNLENHGFFTRILKNGKTLPITGIEGFAVEIREGHAIYSFYVPMKLLVGSEKESFLIAVYDEDFYCHLFFPPEKLGVKGKTELWRVESRPREMPELAYYFGFMNPVALEIHVMRP